MKSKNKFIDKDEYVIGMTAKGHSFFFDKEDFELVKEHSWCIAVDGYTVTCMNGKIVKLHRILMKTEEGQIIDHINRNQLDNRRSNLRFVTRSQNGANSQKRTRICTSVFKGVYFNKRSNNWVAAIKVNYKKKHIGCFKTEIEAALAYNKKALEVFGEYACINDI